MPLKKKWGTPGTRVITPNGYAKILLSYPDGGKVEVKLEKKVAGLTHQLYDFGQVVLDTDFTVVRILNIDYFGFVTSAYNTPTWDEAKEALEAPYIEDETVFALNFETQEFVLNRTWKFIGAYRILEAYYDMHWRVKPIILFPTREVALQYWQEKIESLAGTSNHLLLCVLIDLEGAKILARALFSTLEALKKERFI